MVAQELAHQESRTASNAAGPLPEYAEEMAGFHTAFESELRELLNEVPVLGNQRVLDVACGDGFYSRLLAERLGPDGCVVGLDVNRPYLELAHDQGTSWDRVTFVQGNLKDFPANEEFDLVWCAQSLYSLPQPSTALHQMARLVRPGGVLAVLENDTLHQLLLPWPVSLELAIRTAEYAALTREVPHAEKYYVARQLKGLLAEAGVEPAGVVTQCMDRQLPLSSSLECFLQANLRRLKDRVMPLLNPDLRGEVEALISAESSRFLLDQPHFTMSWINRLVWGRKPEGASRKLVRN